MAQSVSDDLFARAVNQMGAATLEHIETARAAQANEAQNGVSISLADALVKQGILTPAMREAVEKKLLAQKQGGIQRLGKYKLLKKLGEGGMGAVYLADDTAMDRKVALKVLPRKHAGDSEFLTRFRREAKATGKLNHVNIIAAYDSGEDQGHHFYAMEYCEGEPLDSILKRDRFIASKKALEIAIQVARGLKHAHDHGFIHRDIKPANIFMTATGVAKILDLGLTKDISDSQKSFSTQTGVAMGTPHYISPEQARGDKIIDGRTDIYSLGATLYHLVSGQTPFEGSSAGVIMMKHLNDQLPNPQDINEQIPDGVVQVIQKMMAKEAADRYRDCDELLADLEQVVNGKTPSSHALEEGKSSVAMRQKLMPPRRAPIQRTQQRQPTEVPPSLDVQKRAAKPRPASHKQMYVALGGVAVGALILVLAMSLSGKRTVEESRRAEATTSEAAAIPPLSPTPKVTAPLATLSVSTAQPNPDIPAKEMSLDLGGDVKMEMVLVPAGEFTMGADDGEANEKPAHKVKISQPFYMGKYDVTVAQFRAFADSTKYRTEAEKQNRATTYRDGNLFEFTGVSWRTPGFKQEDNHPACAITWNDAQAFLTWARKLTGRDVRLPTEAQWEYAARGTENRKYPWGNKWDGTLANHADLTLHRAGVKYGCTSENDGFAYTSPVGNYMNASWCGTFDMAGNVIQWCQDFTNDKYYAESPAVDPQGPATGRYRIQRGGSFSMYPPNCRSARRSGYYPESHATNAGFRVAVAVVSSKTP